MNERIKSALNGTGLAAAGAVATYLTQWASGHDLGIYTPFVTAGLVVLVNAIRKWGQP
jgi:hypothetical protein